MKLSKIGFGGGCHWCTEAVFQPLTGVSTVEQGWIASSGEHNNFSEAVIVQFDPDVIGLEMLIKVHLHTHKSTSNHSMRKKYRSGIYTFSEEQALQCEEIVIGFQSEFKNKLITGVFPFRSFKPSRSEIQNYYLKNPSKPFCKRYISPKLERVSDLISKKDVTPTL